MEILKATWIFTGILMLGQSVLTSEKQNSASIAEAGLKSILKSAISVNSALFDAVSSSNQGGVVSLPGGVPLLNMTRPTWRIHEANQTKNKEHIPDSVPLPGTSLTALHSSDTEKNVTKQNYTGKTNLTTSGLYIPFEKLSRLKRQVNVSATTKQNDNGRVLFLLNPNSKTNISNVQEKLDGKVLMLVKQLNTSETQGKASPDLISVESRGNLHELLQFGPVSSKLDINLLEVQQSLPAIQMINNLDKIDLQLMPSDIKTQNNSKNFSVSEINSNGLFSSFNDSSLTNRQLRQNINTTPIQGNESQTKNVINNNNSVEQLTIILANSHPQSRVSALSTNIRQGTDRQRGERNITSRQPSRANNAKQVWLSQPQRVSQQEQNLLQQARQPGERQLTLQHSVSSNRLQTHPAGRAPSRNTVTVTRLTRPLVRAVSSHNLNQGRQTRRTVAPVITQRQGRLTIQHQRSPTRRQVIRRRQSPPDPFTIRFSAGFQRGSNLLHQPPLELTSFDGSSNAGFNTLSPAETRLPPFSPFPGGFGGLGVPGFIGGPMII